MEPITFLLVLIAGALIIASFFSRRISKSPFFTAAMVILSAVIAILSFGTGDLTNTLLGVIWTIDFITFSILLFVQLIQR